MPYLPELILQSLEKTWVTLLHNWPFLLASVLISAGLKLAIDPERVSAWLTRYRRVGVVGATAAAVATPFCSCGTTAVILGMLASTLPWAPIVAFMVASPLTSPQELIYSAGLFGWPFAIAFFASSIFLGLLGGAAAEFFESRGWLANQARFTARPAAAASSPSIGVALELGALEQLPVYQAGGSSELHPAWPVLAPAPALAVQSCCGPAIEAPQNASCACSAPGDPGRPAARLQPASARRWFEEIFRAGKQLLPMFLGFAFIGYVLNGLIPQSWVSTLFGQGNVYSVPLAASLGLPLYVNTEGSLPLVRALIDGGMSQGAALAFLITGAGTSFGAVAGAFAIARWRVIGLVVGTLWVGAVAAGFLYDFLLAARWL